MHVNLIAYEEVESVVPFSKEQLKKYSDEQSEVGAYRNWKKFDENDPLTYGLDEILLDRNVNVVLGKNFISKAGSQSNFKNILKPFNESQFNLELSNLNMVGEYYSCWSDSDDTSDQEYIVN